MERRSACFLKKMVMVFLVFSFSVAGVGCGKRNVPDSATMIAESRSQIGKLSVTDTGGVIALPVTHLTVDTSERDSYAWVSSIKTESLPEDTFDDLEGELQRFVQTWFGPGKDAFNTDTAKYCQESDYEYWYNLRGHPQDSIVFLGYSWKKPRNRAYLDYHGVRDWLPELNYYYLHEQGPHATSPVRFAMALDTIERDPALFGEEEARSIDTIWQASRSPVPLRGVMVCAHKKLVIQYYTRNCIPVGDSLRDIVTNTVLAKLVDRDFFCKISLYGLASDSRTHCIAGELYARTTAHYTGESESALTLASVCFVASVSNGKCSISILCNEPQHGLQFVGAYAVDGETIPSVFAIRRKELVNLYYLSHGRLVCIQTRWSAVVEDDC